MKIRILTLILMCLVLANNAVAQSFSPGLIARGYLGGDHGPLKFPTPLVAVISSGKDFHTRIRPIMESELRGVMDIGRIEFSANGYIVLEENSEVKFKINNMICTIRDKDLGNGEYTQKMPKGNHKVELIRRGWNDGTPSFEIVDATTGESVLFHSDAELKRESARYIKVDRKSVKSRLVGNADTAEQGAAANP